MDEQNYKSKRQSSLKEQGIIDPIQLNKDRREIIGEDDG